MRWPILFLALDSAIVDSLASGASQQFFISGTAAITLFVLFCIVHLENCSI